MMKLITKILIPTLVIAAGLGFIAKSAFDDIKATASAYLFTYPLLMMEETRKGSELISATNTLSHNQNFPDGDFRLVVRPNFDTLYSTAWLDLSAGPLVLSMPATDDRYYVLPFMDAWTNVFERRGTSTSGNGAQEIAIIGPDFDGELAAGISSVVNSPTNMVWLIGRIQTNSQADVANVVEIQEKMALTPLAAWQHGERYRGDSKGFNSAKPKVDPMTIVESMDAQTFFSYANRMMAEQLPRPNDAAELAKFSHLNIAPGKEFQLSELNPISRWAVEKSLTLTRDKIDEEIVKTNFNDQGWNLVLDDIGVYGTNYLMRTAVAKVGLGALPAKEAAYPSTRRQSDGERYDGSKFKYRLHFAADKLPPVDAFWSLTMYDFEGFMKHNEIERYSIGDRSGLTLNDDGSLDIYIQHQRPKQGVSNWLPAPQEEFNLVLRLYLPHDSFLNGEWIVPAIEKIGPASSEFVLADKKTGLIIEQVGLGFSSYFLGAIL